MILASCSVTDVRTVGANVHVLAFRSAEIASTIIPGQFVNIKASEGVYPLLRRPFSVYGADGDNVSIIFDVRGAGTQALRGKKPGEAVHVLGPLGKGYGIAGDYETALLVGGGLGVAPLPLAAREAAKLKRVVVFLGSRSGGQIVTEGLEHANVATDDGSMGRKGTVVELLSEYLKRERPARPKIFGCGPSAMLRSLQTLAAETGVPCELSIESAMACGIGICQGCPVARVGGTGGYALVCREGPVFDAGSVEIA